MIATDVETGNDVSGYIYICRDQNAWHSNTTHLMDSRRFKSMTTDEIQAELEKLGVFALISTKEISEENVLGEYYTRQGVEQFFDYAKNYANYLPVRNHTVETLRSHLLLGFMSTFFLILIENRLRILDSQYVVVPNSPRPDVLLILDNGDRDLYTS